MPNQATLELWISMLETAQKERVKAGGTRDPDVDEQLRNWHADLAEMKAKDIGA